MENWTTDLKRLLELIERRKRSSVIDLEAERKKRAAAPGKASRPQSSDSKGGQESGDDWE